MQSYTVRQTISQFTGHQLALPTTINFYYVESASDALAQAVQQSGLAADLLEVTENEVVPVGTSLRTFEDWGTAGDDQIRAGFPAQSLTDAEIATRQAQLDAARRYAARQQADPLTRYEQAAQLAKPCASTSRQNSLVAVNSQWHANKSRIAVCQRLWVLRPASA